MDQCGYDISNTHNKDIDNLINTANSLPSCIAFNTLGFFKDNVSELTPSIYFSDKDGIYVKKEYYFTNLKKK